MFPNNKYFGPKLKFIWFYMSFLHLTNVRVHISIISNITIVFFKIVFKDMQIMYFWTQIYFFSLLHETSDFDKFKSAEISKLLP